jgi:hypothetical protein
MKKILVILGFFISQMSFAQSTCVGYFWEESGLFVSRDNYQKNMGFYMGGHVYSPYVPPIFFTSPRTYPNRIGINYAILNNGINLGGGVKATYVDLTNVVTFQPDFVVRFHPIKFLTGNNKSIDVSFMVNLSDRMTYGLGISLPYPMY